MKWSRSNKKKDSFNCITHPHSTSRLELLSLSAGMDIVKNNAPADDVLLNRPPRHNLFLAPRSRRYKHSHPRIQISHRRTKCVTRWFFRLQTDLAPKKTINVPLSPAILQKLTSLWWEFRCQLHAQRQICAQILTRAVLYLWQPKTRQIVKCHLVTFWRS